MSVTVRIVFAPDWLAQLRAAEAEFSAEHIGPDITEDAKQFVPVDTGRLQRSLDWQVVDGENGAPEVQIGAFPDDDGPIAYAAPVECGFHGEEYVHEYINHDFMGTGREVLIRPHRRHGNTPEQPYLVPALYQERY
jgi:hypothetical protein